MEDSEESDVRRRAEELGVVSDHSRYVGMCDVLGFRDLVGRLRLEEITSMYGELVKRVTDVTSTRRTVEWTLGGESFVSVNMNRTRYAVFSDTVIMWSPEINSRSLRRLPPGDFQRLAKLDGPGREYFGHPGLRQYESPPVRHGANFFSSVGWLVSTGLDLGLPLRVGIAFGDCVVRPAKRLFVGRPFIDAYETEQRQQWIGGACHGTCYLAPGFGWLVAREHLRKTSLHTYRNWLAISPLVEYPVPVKPRMKGPSLQVAVNWPWALWNGEGRAMDRRLSAEYLAVKGTRAAQKWDNARTFYRRMRRRGVWPGM